VATDGEVLGYGSDCPYCHYTNRLLYQLEHPGELELRDEHRCQHLFEVDARHTLRGGGPPKFVFTRIPMT
jgi:glutaredoxin